jgi:predicted ATPase
VGRDLPTGTVTFLFTDVEGSTRLLDELGAEAYAKALTEHRREIRAACASEGGIEVDTQGDAFFFAFPTAPGALAAASTFTEALASGPIQVRVGVHTGTPLLTSEGYVGHDVHRAARVAAAGHGRQVLVSASTAALVEIGLMDLGEHRLKDLSAPERIYQLGAAEFPPLKSLYRTNLPVPATPFLGRERELAEVAGLLADTRLLTLTGPGGTGKTRLALQAVAASADAYPDGVFWVPLAALRDPELVIAAASQAIGARNGLAEHIRDKRLLVLFDNFEHVLAAAPGLSDLLARCPNLELMVTSREPLHLTAEQEYAVLPFVHEEGVGFFVAKARTVVPHFAPDENVSKICRRLDDLPLALELAAARVRALTSAQILERLEHRLPLLTGGDRDLPERQRTLRATIEWSYELLTETEQRLFARLAVFRGGCTLAAAQDVCDADLGTLQSLVDKSLVRFSNGRYWMLETIREYAGGLLVASPDSTECARKHAEHFLQLALAAEPALAGPAQADWLDRLDADQDNVRAAIDWSLETGNAELGLRLAVSLRRNWQLRGSYREKWKYLSALVAFDQPPELRVLALRDLYFFATELNELDAAEQYAEERRQLCHELGDDDGANRALQNIGLVAELRGDLDQARAVYEEVLAKGRELGARIDVPLTNLAWVAWKQGQLADAEALCEEALAIRETLGDHSAIVSTCIELAGVRLYQGRRDVAAAPLKRALSLVPPLRSLGHTAYALEVAALAAADAKQSTQLLGKADALREEIGEQLPRPNDDPYERAAASALEHLGQEQFDVAHGEGRALPLDDAIALALEVIDAG